MRCGHRHSRTDVSRQSQPLDRIPDDDAAQAVPDQVEGVAPCGLHPSSIWTAGDQRSRAARPNVGLNSAAPGGPKFASAWHPVPTEKLAASIPPWTDQWFKALGDGTIASLPTGAWMPGNLASGA